MVKSITLKVSISQSSVLCGLISRVKIDCLIHAHLRITLSTVCSPWFHLNCNLFSILCLTTFLILLIVYYPLLVYTTLLCLCAKIDGAEQTEEHWKQDQSIEQAKTNDSHPTLVDNNEW